MALNLSTLTSPATSGDVLAEALTTADFLEPTPVLRNLSRGSNKGGDAKQGTALNQPKALPLDANGKGYCYLPVTTGNAPAVTFPTIGANDDFVLEMVAYIVNVEDFHVVSGSSLHRILIYNTGGSPSFQYRDGSNNNNAALSGSLSAGLSTLRFEKTGSTLVFKQNGAVKGTINNITAAPTFTHLSFNGQFSTSRLPLNGYVQSVTLSIGGTEQLNIDFTATNVRHGDTKFKCATGQVVTINQSGNDPATVIKKSVLRFDGVNDALRGLFANNIDGGYMFAAFSVLGDGGSGNDNRVFSVNANGAGDVASSGFVYGLQYGGNPWLAAYGAGAYSWAHPYMYNNARGDILYEAKAKSGGLISKVNNANKFQPTTTLAIASNEFNVGNSIASLARPAAIDLEFLALFPASITDAQADSVRNYINNRNNVFSLVDGFGYYFYDAQNAPAVPITAGSSSWNGRIVGSDNGDSDRYLTQGTTNDSPVGNGYTVTFADNSDHLDIPSTTQAGWQIVGTSLGTFAYRVDNTAVTELNLLGNLGSTSYRKAGDLYGIILLPESATGADIEAARKLLIDRGAAEGFTGSNLYSAWYQRGDIVEFKGVPMPEVTNIGYSFASQTALVSFPAMSFPAVTFAANAWQGNTSMSDFGAIQAPLGNNFSNAWNGCSALTSFPAGAKLGTAASNVNFTNAWQDSGLTSFPPLDLSTGTNFAAAFQSSDLTSFPAGINISNGTNFANTWRSTDLTSYSTPIVSGTNLNQAFYLCGQLTDFSSNVLENWNPASVTSGVFHNTWKFCTSLTSQSVENILTSIDASNQHGTDDGTSTGSPLGDSGIDIDYNVATGSLSAATNSAIDSLSGKGWEVFINGVLVIPNILDLAPAAAYSLRSFDADADPNVVNVRRSSDNATSDFKASEVSDGTLVAFVGAGNDGHITTWYDQGGTNHANQSTASSQPKIVDGGTLVTEGGLAALDFDGVDDELVLNTDISNTTDPRTYVAVFTANDSDSFILGGNNPSFYETYGNGIYIVNSEIKGKALSNSNGVLLESGVTPNATYLVTLRLLDTDSSIYVNGTEEDTSSNNLYSHPYESQIGGGQYSNDNMDGTIQEIVIYDTDQSANRTGIEANINDTYTIY